MKIMKMEKKHRTIKIAIIILAIICISSIFAIPVKATDIKDVTVDGIIDIGKSWIENGEKSAGDYKEPDTFISDLLPIGQILVAIGIGTLTIVSVIMAIQWITATPDKQAQLKQQLIGLLIAAFVIFGAVGIWEFVRNIMSQTGLV